MDQGQQLNAIKTVVDGPLSPIVKKEYKNFTEKKEWLFSFILIALLAFMTMAAIFCNADGSFSKEATITVALGFILAMIWAIGYRLIQSFKPQGKTEWDTFRINEIYEEGAISTSAYSKTIIGWDEVLGLWETKNYIALQSEQGDIIWQTEYLTPEAMNVILNHLESHVPDGTIHKKEPIYGKASNPYRIPQLPERQPLLTQAGFSEKKSLTIWSRFSNTLMKSAAGIFLIAADFAGIIGSQFDFQNTILDNSIFWLAVICLACAAIIYGVCSLEQMNKKPMTGFIYFYPIGIVIADGKNQYFISKEEVLIRQLKLEFRQKGLCINAEQSYSIEAIENYNR